MRRAFAATIKDSEFIADAKKSKLDIDYVAGTEIESYVDRIYSMPGHVRETLQFLMRKTDKR